MNEALEGVEGFRVRQKLQIFEQFCYVCEKQNEYYVGGLPQGFRDGDQLRDEQFQDLKSEEILHLQEHSTCCCRVCCGNAREFTMDAFPSMNNYNHSMFQFFRPFHCCFCCQEIFIRQGDEELGHVECDCRCFRACCCGEFFFRVKQGDQTLGWIKHIEPCCCNCCTNCCAPSCLNEQWVDEILSPNEDEVVGFLRDHYPGLGMRCLADSDNYTLTFPANSTNEQKAIWLGGLMLIDFVFFEKEADQDGNSG
uniref:Phospholipid scramblase n=1 Tax=Paramoeba aestuarina TaxID=180227 RepID=A0A7S4K8Z3_9EUKA|mmetsp:Transcript_1642/g.2524  ORF Transcript_1642/g.2524 Transcript_1642/m.2524 type:complete len:252 (+) Transcript_1642:154-909(+)